MLCGFPLRELLFLGDFKKDYLCHEVFGTLANGQTILATLIGSWLIEAVPSGQVTQRLKGEHCIALGVTTYIFDINVKKQLQHDETYEEPMMSMCISSTENFIDPKKGALVLDSQSTMLNNDSECGGVITKVDADEGKGGGLRVTPLQDPSLPQCTGPPIDSESEKGD